jgi:RHS repeat-associated protein
MLTGLNMDEFFQRTDSNGAQDFLTDAVGSTLAFADAGGTIDTTYTYEPFGSTTISGASTNPYQFTGRENDGTGLYFYRARYYSPLFQRFISQDPIGFGGAAINLYGYVTEDPIELTDPSGQAFYAPVHISFPIFDISCSTLGGLLLGGAGATSGVLIGSLFPPAAEAGPAIVEPLLGSVAGSMGGMMSGDELLGQSGLCTPNRTPQTCR